MAHSPAVNHVCYAIALLCIASYCCQGMCVVDLPSFSPYEFTDLRHENAAQDAIQIVARAALCFDNRMVSVLDLLLTVILAFTVAVKSR